MCYPTNVTKKGNKIVLFIGLYLNRQYTHQYNLGLILPTAAEINATIKIPLSVDHTQHITRQLFLIVYLFFFYLL